MNDCPNADVRDLLPDLVHGRLDAESRGMVEAHIAGCDDCSAELALLRSLDATFRVRTPTVDVAGIVAAIPAYRAPARRSWVGWRTAAAITMIAAGGSSLVMLRNNVAPVTDSVAVRSLPSTPAAPPAPVTGTSAGAQPDVQAAAAPTEVAVAVPATGRGRELAMAGGTMTDLNDKELAALLADIDKMDAIPSADVESPALAPISPRGVTP
jgi:anti-sigma factor RsiW